METANLTLESKSLKDGWHILHHGATINEAHPNGLGSCQPYNIVIQEKPRAFPGDGVFGLQHPGSRRLGSVIHIVDCADEPTDGHDNMLEGTELLIRSVGPMRISQHLPSKNATVVKNNINTFIITWRCTCIPIRNI